MGKSTVTAFKTESSTKTRDSNIELFRIITMFLIVAHHYVINSGLTYTDGVVFGNPTSWRSIFLLLFGAWGKTGINCFVLITGYFMCKNQITFKKYIKLLLEIYLYRVLFYIIFLIAGYETVSVIRIIKLIAPITAIQTDFTSCFLVFFLLIPFLNILIKALTKRNYVRLLIVLLLIYVIIGSIPTLKISFSYVSWFCVLYLIAAFVRNYPCALFDNTKVWGWISILVIVIAVSSVVVCTIVPPIFEISPKPFVFLADANRILACAVAFSCFMFFKNIKIKPSNFINTVASTTFGILLIHANSDAMRTWLWKDTLDNVGMYNSPYLILHAFASVTCIFVICSTIDYLRIVLIEKPFFRKCWGGTEVKLTNIWNKIIDKITNVNDREQI